MFDAELRANANIRASVTCSVTLNFQSPYAAFIVRI